MKEIVGKLELIKIKSICSAKDNGKRMRKQATDLEKIFLKDTSNKILLSKIYKDLSQVNNKKTNNLIKNTFEDFDRHFRKDTQIENKHMKRCFTFCAIREMQIKTMMWDYYTLTEWPESGILATANANKVIEQELSFIVGENAKR